MYSPGAGVSLFQLWSEDLNVLWSIPVNWESEADRHASMPLDHHWLLGPRHVVYPGGIRCTDTDEISVSRNGEKQKSIQIYTKKNTFVMLEGHSSSLSSSPLRRVQAQVLAWTTVSWSVCSIVSFGLIGYSKVRYLWKCFGDSAFPHTIHH
jgi:hypothetical protein